MHLDTLIPTLGYVGLAAIIFAESGLLIGFFLPGDSVLFTAGFLASQGIFDIKILALICFIAAVAGDSVGYAFGRKVGRRLFHKHDSMLFSKENLERAEKFYEAHGRKTIIIARFLPVIRTFAPIVAGIGDMHYKTFVAFNLIGGLLWAVGLTVAGYFLGSLIPDVDKYLLPIIVVIVLISVLPAAVHLLKEESSRKHLKAMIAKVFKRS